MIKNFSIKILTLIFLSAFVYIILNIIYIKNLRFKTFVSVNYPKIQKTIFATPAILDLEDELRDVLYNVKMKPSYLERKINKTQFVNFKEDKYLLGSYTYKAKRMKAVGFIDFHNENLFIVSGTGEVKFINVKNISKIETEATKVATNINDLINDKTFYDVSENMLSQFNSISDILIYEDFIYLSFNRELKDNCYTKSIIRSKINYKFLKFEDFFFNKKECRKFDKDKVNLMVTNQVVE